VQRGRVGGRAVFVLEPEKEPCHSVFPSVLTVGARTARRAYLVIERGHAPGSPRPLCEIRCAGTGISPDLDRRRLTGAASSCANCGLSTRLRGIAAEASATACRGTPLRTS
jgi:hypothetical protein